METCSRRISEDLQEGGERDVKIVVIAPSALPSRRANAIQTIRMAHAFARLGHEVLLVAYAPHPQPLSQEERGDGLPSPLGRRVGDEGLEQPSPPAPLAQEESGESPHPPPLSQRARGDGLPSPLGGRVGDEGLVSPPPPSSLPQGERWSWEALAEEYGLECPFEIRWLGAKPWARRYDFALQAVWQAHRWGADWIFTRLPQAAALASLLGIRTVFEAHDLPRGAAARLFRLFLLGRGAKRVIAISQALADDLQKRFPDLGKRGAGFLHLAPDGVDLSRYTPLLSPAEARKKLRERGWELCEGFIAGYTGHLYGGRGADLIVALVSRLPEVHFLIVGGEGEQRQQLDHRFRSQGLTNTTLTGLVAPSQVALFQMASDVLLMPYQEKVEASSGGDIARYLSPLKLFEYLASGRPILTSDLPVLREIVTAENAILLPGQEIGAWENALRRLIQNPPERHKLGEAARRTAEGYSWENRAARILAD